MTSNSEACKSLIKVTQISQTPSRFSDDPFFSSQLVRNPTKYMVWHELGHYSQLQKIGISEYLMLARPRAPEQFVYDLLRGSKRRWELLNGKEQLHWPAPYFLVQ